MGIILLTGGPLYHVEDDGELTAIGVAVRLQNPDCGTYPVIYTEVSWFIDWFEKAMKDYP